MEYEREGRASKDTHAKNTVAVLIVLFIVFIFVGAYLFTAGRFSPPKEQAYPTTPTPPTSSTGQTQATKPALAPTSSPLKVKIEKGVFSPSSVMVKAGEEMIFYTEEPNITYQLFRHPGVVMASIKGPTTQKPSPQFFGVSFPGPGVMTFMVNSDDKRFAKDGVLQITVAP